MDVLCLGEEFVYERIADEKADFQLPSQYPSTMSSSILALMLCVGNSRLSFST